MRPRPLPSSVHVVSSVLLLNMAIALFGASGWLIGTLLVSGPFLMVWMVWQVLRDQSLPMRDLEAGETWGYQDRPDLRPVKDSAP